MQLRGCVLAAVLVACVHGSAVPDLPSKGGPAWLEVASPHFVVWTDSSEARARDLAQRMEDYRRVLITLLFGGTDVKSPPILVFALRDADALAARGMLLAVHGKPGADEQLAAALAADPTELVARLVSMARAHGAIALADARATAAAHPDDWCAWYLVVRAAPGSPEASDAKTKLCELVKRETPPDRIRELCSS